MKKLLFITILLVLSGAALSQVPTWQWAVEAGGTNVDKCFSITADNQGNVFITGVFQGNAHFGATELTSSGMDDIFIAKLDTDGNWLWAVKAGGEYFDDAYGIAADDAGNVYVTGSFNYSAIFGSLSLTSGGTSDVYVTKLDTNGNFIWAVRGGGFSADQGCSIAVNTTGIVITGYVRGDVAFGSHPLTGFGEADIFIAKLDANGNWLWARNAGGIYYDAGYSVALDSMGNVYATGYFEDDANFSGTILTSLGGEDIFITKLNPDGFLIAAFRAGGISEDMGTGIALDTSGNVYLTGYFMLSIAFGPTVMTSYGNADIFVTKMNSGAIYQWARQAGGLSDDVGISIVSDSQGNSYVTGYFMDAALFANVTLTGYGLQDAYIAKLDPNGFLSWVVKGGGTYWDYGQGIAFSGSGNIYCAGVFENTAVFGNSILTSQGDRDIFVTKLYSSNVANDDTIIPSAAAHSLLFDAFPNPFHSGGIVQIKTAVAKGESGTLSIYNLRGQSVASYNLSSGAHETGFDSAGLASGVYLYQLQTLTTNTAKKLVLLK
jgi:hypothetical protein